METAEPDARPGLEAAADDPPPVRRDLPAAQEQRSLWRSIWRLRGVALELLATVLLFPGLWALLGRPPTIPSLVVVVVLFLGCDFVGRFVVRGWMRRKKLDALIEQLRVVRIATAGDGVAGVDERTMVVLKRQFDECELDNEWTEFTDTLHEAAGQAGDESSATGSRYLQTAPVEAFLTRSAVIERPLSTEYFKHLPGLLTGLGIIATFFGLIDGLREFEFASDTTVVRSTVGELVHAVKEAFSVSATAIALAMLVTWAEKHTLERLYRRLHDIQVTVNHLFQGVPAEKYLARIELRSDESANALRQLRSGLVDEFQRVADTLAQTIERTSAQAAESIGQQLVEPVETLQQAISQTLGQQETAVHQLLDSTLERFAARLEEAVGRHLTSAAEELSTAIDELRQVLERAPRELDEVLEKIRAALVDVAGAVAPMHEHAERMAAASERLTAAVETSAETWDYASQQFRRTTATLEEVAGRLEPAAGHVSEAADRLDASVAALASASTSLADASTALDRIQRLLAELADTLDGERQQRDELATAVERAAEQLQAGQRSVDAFMEGVERSLAGALAEFGARVRRTSDETYDGFATQLEIAVGTLAGAVDDLGRFVDERLAGVLREIGERAAGTNAEDEASAV